MKLLVIGIGDCGSKLASEFAKLNKKARSERNINIVTRAYAVNANQASLTALTRSKPDLLETFFVHDSTESGGKSSEAGAEIMRMEGERMVSAMKPGDFFQTDAFLFVAGAAGSLGSGGVPIIAQRLKERYVGKPVYVLVVLPFESEAAEAQCVYNTALCLKSVAKVADAVFLAGNEGFKIAGGVTIPEDMSNMNKEIVLPFYDLLCASEVGSSGYIGTRPLSIGDVLQTLSGWTAISFGKTQLPMSQSFWKRGGDFREKGSETLKAMEAMNMALGRLPVGCRLEDAGKALYLISIPAKEANIDINQALGKRLRELAHNAEIRGGDFHGTKGFAQVTVVASGLSYVDEVKNYYDKAVALAQDLKPD